MGMQGTNSSTLRILLSVVVMTVLSALQAAAAFAPQSSVSFRKALADAESVAALNAGWSVMKAAGDSMNPHFGDSSLLLVDQVSFERLQSGMIVVYRDAQGDLVGHRLIEKTANGWVARAANSTKNDPVCVTAQNFVGVVFGALHYSPETAGSADLPVVYGKRY